jgi:predicted  nucleic acid-binding Zn-ribbon protein
MNSEEFRDDLSQITGVDLTPFFDGWVFKGGYPAVELNNFTVGNNNEVSVEVEQKLRGIDSYFTAMPVELLFTNSQGDSTYRNIMVNGHISIENFSLPFEPTTVLVNPNRQLALAHTEIKQEITATGNIPSSDVLMQSLRATSVNSSGDLHIELYWVRADDVKEYDTKAFKVSQDRYWKVSSSEGSDFDLSANMLFDAGNGGGYLDSALLLNYPEDSLVLLHRPHTNSDWEVYNHVTYNNLGNSNDGRGVMQIDLLLDGEYTLGVKDQSALGVENQTESNSNVTLFPNPSSGETNVSLNNPDEQIESITCFSIDGKIVFNKMNDSNSLTIPKQTKGNYVIQVKTNLNSYKVKFIQQ